jgi:hypothetical protein
MPHVTPLHAEDPRRVGRFRLAGRIEGVAAAGPVYLATAVDGSEVTITLLDGEWADDAAARDRFTAEANAARRVAPFCATRILGAGFDGGHAFLVSEYVAGPSLLEFVTDEGPWEDADLEALAIGSATGLAAVHQAGLVHGDFGPEHVVLGAEGPRVINYGITPPYGSATPAADMRAWAETVLYAAVGEPPDPTDPEELDLLPEPLLTLVSLCTSADPADQPTARSVVLELLGDEDPPAGVLAEGTRRAERAAVQPVPAAEAGPAAPRTRRTRPAMVWWVSGVAVCVAVIVVAILFAQSQTGPPPDAIKPTPTHQPSTSPHASSPSPTSTVTVPATLAGVWSGHITQSNPPGPPDTFSVTLNLSAGTNGGSVHYSGTSFSCAGDLSTVSNVLGTLKLNQQILPNETQCDDGVVTVSLGQDNTLMFTYKANSGVATGTLTKAT